MTRTCLHHHHPVLHLRWIERDQEHQQARPVRPLPPPCLRVHRRFRRSWARIALRSAAPASRIPDDSPGIVELPESWQGSSGWARPAETKLYLPFTCRSRCYIVQANSVWRLPNHWFISIFASAKIDPRFSLLINKQNVNRKKFTLHFWVETFFSGFLNC